MVRTKLKKFKEIQELENVKEFPENIKGKWSEHFQNNNDLVLELACGHGDYTLELAQRYPHKNIIGVDIKGNRIWTGAKRAQELGLSNVCFLRIGIEQISDYFDEQEVHDIWITFPDPFPRKSKIRRRLTHKKFLEQYKVIIKPGALLHFKTDDKPLFEYSIESLSMFGANIKELIEDVHGACHNNDLLDILTTYEKSHLADGRTIYYFQADLNVF